MSDFSSALPVRTENDGDVVVKVGDATLPSQQLAVNADGSVNITDNSGSLTVDAVDFDIRDLSSTQDSIEVLQATHDNLNANANIQVGDADVDNANPVPVSDAGGSLTVDAVNLDIRDLVFATDKVDVSGSVVALDAGTLAALESITVQNGAGASAVNIQDGGNSITVDGTVSASNFPATADTNFGTVGASTIRTAAEIGNATGAADFNAGATGAQTLRTASNLYLSGTAVSGLNPIPVTVTSVVAGTSIQNYNTSAALAAAASSNHDYTVTALKTLELARIWASASGKLKIEVQYETAAASGVFNTKFVGFNSTANPNIDITVVSAFGQVAGARIRVIRTNLDKQAEDVYSTIEGTEV